MQNQILLQNVSPERLIELIKEGVKSQLEDFKKNFPTHNPDEILTRKQTCNFLQIDSSTLWAWTKKDKVKVYGIANRRYYKKAELLQSLIPLKK
ncbi:MAG: hypothetical protein ACJA2M_001916 [Polaribacter sp.]|jgi:hypothetical protein